jgi:hypothetical protein
MCVEIASGAAVDGLPAWGVSDVTPLRADVSDGAGISIRKKIVADSAAEELL